MKSYTIQATVLTLALASLALAAPAQAALPGYVQLPEVLGDIEEKGPSPACAGATIVNYDTTGDHGAYATGWIEHDGCVFYGVFDRYSTNSSGDDDYYFTGAACPGPTEDTCYDL